MPKDSNSFEEAMQLCSDSDPTVARVAGSLYQQMLSAHQNNGDSPEAGFNILYFIQTGIHLYLSRHPAVSLLNSKYPYPSVQIRGTNWPAGAESSQHDVVRQFLELVRVDSTLNGEDFDVSYGARIIELSFDAEGRLRSLPSVDLQSEEDYDYWLSGFNTHQGLAGS